MTHSSIRSYRDSGEADRVFQRKCERHSGINPNTIGARSKCQLEKPIP